MLVLGDAHATDPANREALFAAYDAADADLALQLGDLEHYDLPVETWFVAGNNEDFDVIDALRRGEQPPGVDGANLLASTAVELEGRTVAGLSGNYAPTRYEYDRADLEGDRRRHFVRADVERLLSLEDAAGANSGEPSIADEQSSSSPASQARRDAGAREDTVGHTVPGEPSLAGAREGVDVLLTHEAPHGLLYCGYDPGCEHVDRLLRELEPELCLVGHHHRHEEAEIAGCRVVSLAPVWERYYRLDPASLELESHETPV